MNIRVNSFDDADARMQRLADSLYLIALGCCQNNAEREACNRWYTLSVELGNSVMADDFDAAKNALDGLTEIFEEHIKDRNQELSLLLGSLLLKFNAEFLLAFDNAATV